MDRRAHRLLRELTRLRTIVIRPTARWSSTPGGRGRPPSAGESQRLQAWAESGAKDLGGHATTIADGGYPGTGPIIPHCRPKGGELCACKVEHVFARMKTYKILRDCRLRGAGVHHAMLGIARLHNLMLTA